MLKTITYQKMGKKAAEYRQESLSILKTEDLKKLTELLQTLKQDLSSKI